MPLIKKQNYNFCPSSCTFNSWYVNKYSRDLHILVRDNKYNLKYLNIIKNMFGYECSSRIVEKSTRNQVTGYKLTSPLWVWVNFLGKGWLETLIHNEGIEKWGGTFFAG